MKFSIIEGLAYIVAGIALFFWGMKFFSLGVGNSVKRRKNMLTKLDKFGRVGYFFGGVFTTAIIQSSDATTILSMNLADEEIMDKSKALALSFGARVGTTITAFLATLGEIGISSIIIGLSLPLGLLCPKKHPNVKNAFLGFGLFFVGLSLLKQGTAESEILISSLFSNTGNYILLFFIGLLFTAVIQSSSATSSLLVILTSAEIMDIRCAFFVYLGATIGTTATPLLASFKMGKDAKYIASGYSISAFIIGIISLVIGNFIVDDILMIMLSIPQSLRLALFGMVYSFISSIVSLILQSIIEYLSQKRKQISSIV